MFRLQIPAKRRFSRQELSRWLRFAGAGISTFFLSNVRLLGSLSPFGTALVMALPRPNPDRQPSHYIPDHSHRHLRAANFHF